MFKLPARPKRLRKYKKSIDKPPYVHLHMFEGDMDSAKVYQVSKDIHKQKPLFVHHNKEWYDEIVNAQYISDAWSKASKDDLLSKYVSEHDMAWCFTGINQRLLRGGFRSLHEDFEKNKDFVRELLVDVEQLRLFWDDLTGYKFTGFDGFTYHGEYGDTFIRQHLRKKGSSLVFSDNTDFIGSLYLHDAPSLMASPDWAKERNKIHSYHYILFKKHFRVALSPWTGELYMSVRGITMVQPQ